MCNIQKIYFHCTSHRNGGDKEKKVSDNKTMNFRSNFDLENVINIIILISF